eukprot:31533-Prymnesium_polylepis.1
MERKTHAPGAPRGPSGTQTATKRVYVTRKMGQRELQVEFIGRLDEPIVTLLVVVCAALLHPSECFIA